MKVSGLSDVLFGLTEAEKNFIAGAVRGLKRAGLLVQGDAQKLTPVDEGNLRGSAYTELVGTLTVQVGYTAEYAPHVHEDLQARHTVGEAKFLEKSVQQNAGDVLKILHEEMKI